MTLPCEKHPWNDGKPKGKPRRVKLVNPEKVQSKEVLTNNVKKKLLHNI